MTAYLHCTDQDKIEDLKEREKRRDNEIQKAQRTLASAIGADEVTLHSYSGSGVSGFSVQKPEDYEPPEFILESDSPGPENGPIYSPDKRYNDGKELDSTIEDLAAESRLVALSDEVGLDPEVFTRGKLFRPGLSYCFDSDLFIFTYAEKAYKYLSYNDKIPDSLERITYKEKDELIEQAEEAL